MSRLRTVLRQWLQRRLYRPASGSGLAAEPVSREFGFDRGRPIDRFYIEHFLSSRRRLIRGAVLEIADSAYSRRFAEPGACFEVLHYTADNPLATIVGDLCNPASLPEGRIDCFIATQTLNFIYDFRAAVRGIHHLLAPGGVALVTVAGISQISRYDMERWGDYWRFTTLSMRKVFDEVFGAEQVEVDCYGNVASATAFLQGLACEDMDEAQLLLKDEDYQMTITVVARKC